MDTEDAPKSNVARPDVLKSYSEAILEAVLTVQETALANGYEFRLWIRILPLLLTGCVLG